MSDQTKNPAAARGLFWTSIVVAYAAIVLFPIFWMAAMMVMPDDAMFARPTVWLFTPTLEHFSYVFELGFLLNILTSFILSLVSTALVIVIGTPAAYAFARFEMKFKDDLFLFILATRMAPPVCLVIPFYLIFAKVSLLDSFTGLTLAYMTFNLSFYVWVLRSFCRDLPVELEEAAALEGWSRIQIFRQVVFPLLRNGIVATAVCVSSSPGMSFCSPSCSAASPYRRCRCRSPSSLQARAYAGARWRWSASPHCCRC
jgi:multiple sugar transport system permease protein